MEIINAHTSMSPIITFDFFTNKVAWVTSVLFQSLHRSYVKLKKMWGELISIGIVLIAYAFYKLTRNRAEHFKERNLKYRNARSIFKSHLKKLDVLQMTSETYNAYPDEP